MNPGTMIDERRMSNDECRTMKDEEITKESEDWKIGRYEDWNSMVARRNEKVKRRRGERERTG